LSDRFRRPDGGVSAGRRGGRRNAWRGAQRGGMGASHPGLVDRFATGRSEVAARSSSRCSPGCSKGHREAALIALPAVGEGVREASCRQSSEPHWGCFRVLSKGVVFGACFVSSAGPGMRRFRGRRGAVRRVLEKPFEAQPRGRLDCSSRESVSGSARCHLAFLGGHPDLLEDPIGGFDRRVPVLCDGPVGGAP
jgi:hypothetical protein